ncbi:MAG: imidazole glycerol phosphate synthase subunit HisH, partial [Burkholderiaceae bacterium]|nr:imidazole glycerol phosphate synthase subunit HisH [Burkholderiaceae bacterium]
EDGLFAGLGAAARFYFLHSYYFAPNDPADVLASTEYGLRFACAVQRGNVFGVQFHPEKSHAWGIQLLKNFASL